MLLGTASGSRVCHPWPNISPVDKNVCLSCILAKIDMMGDHLLDIFPVEEKDTGTCIFPQWDEQQHQEFLNFEKMKKGESVTMLYPSDGAPVKMRVPCSCFVSN